MSRPPASSDFQLFGIGCDAFACLLRLGVERAKAGSGEASYRSYAVN